VYCELCMKGLGQCFGCKEEFKTIAVHQPARDRIAKLRFYCHKKCDQELTLETKDVHLKSECVHRMSQCRLCKMEIILSKVEEHHNTVCSHRRLRCPGCHQWMQAKDLNQHVATEPEHIVRLMEQSEKQYRDLTELFIRFEQLLMKLDIKVESGPVRVHIEQEIPPSEEQR